MLIRIILGLNHHRRRRCSPWRYRWCYRELLWMPLRRQKLNHLRQLKELTLRTRPVQLCRRQRTSPRNNLLNRESSALPSQMPRRSCTRPSATWNGRKSPSSLRRTWWSSRHRSRPWLIRNTAPELQHDTLRTRPSSIPSSSSNELSSRPNVSESDTPIEPRATNISLSLQKASNPKTGTNITVR